MVLASFATRSAALGFLRVPFRAQSGGTVGLEAFPQKFKSHQQSITTKGRFGLPFNVTAKNLWTATETGPSAVGPAKASGSTF